MTAQTLHNTRPALHKHPPKANARGASAGHRSGALPSVRAPLVQLCRLFKKHLHIAQAQTHPPATAGTTS
jgi:hypothetical protein